MVGIRLALGKLDDTGFEGDYAGTVPASNSLCKPELSGSVVYSSMRGKTVLLFAFAISATFAHAQKVKPAEVKGVYLRQSYNYGVGGAMITVFSPYLLLNDGTFWKKMDVPPMELDVQKSRSAEPR